MKLNHINLVVANVEVAVKFFEQYFSFKCIEVKGDNIIAVLKNADDFTLVIMANKSDSIIYPDAFHIGFMLDNKEEVITTYKQLKTDGIEVGNEPKKIRDSFGFYFTFENIMIEVGHYLN
jgi:catechol 2,3-dioxygenase-like lactoylglutathione lyase family enzyme